MGEAGRSIHDSLIGTKQTQRGKCKNCSSPLELYELDFKKSTKVMRCQRCGMLHVYRKDIIGKWRLQKAQKIDMSPR